MSLQPVKHIKREARCLDGAPAKDGGARPDKKRARRAAAEAMLADDAVMDELLPPEAAEVSRKPKPKPKRKPGARRPGAVAARAGAAPAKPKPKPKPGPGPGPQRQARTPGGEPLGDSWDVGPYVAADPTRRQPARADADADPTMRRSAAAAAPRVDQVGDSWDAGPYTGTAR